MSNEATIKKCYWYMCKEPATHGVHCFSHYRLHGLTASYETGTDKEVIVKPAPKPIAKKSEKMKAEDKDYNAWKKEYLSRPENQNCRIKLIGCKGKATVINHKKRRFKGSKMNEKYVEPSCDFCNIKIENLDKQAREAGHLQTKYLM